MNASQIPVIERIIQDSLQVLKLYQEILDLFVVDFFVDNHWSMLPQTWQSFFIDIDPSDLAKMLLGTHTQKVMPLSLIALLQTIKNLAINRSITITKDHVQLDHKLVNYDTCAYHPKLKNLFLKHVKLKKRHEISLMAKVVANVAIQSGCPAVIDFGSGMGHLVRVLAYKNNIYAAGIECQRQLSEEARQLDQQLEYTVKKYLSPESMSKLRQPLHINMTLSSSHQLQDLNLPETMSSYGLVGLHPCGDLGPLLLQQFINSSNVKFICVVGCCYNKLTSNGYPMSQYTKSLDCELSYPAREIACHAIDTYCERLSKGDYEDLKIHAYRAALERMLVEMDPNLRHAPVRSVKHSNSMTFQSYCTLALSRLNIALPTAAARSQGARDVTQWRRVLLVYTLRLFLAPLVETVLLLDRVLYVLQHGYSCEIRPVFDPKISPRNHIIIGRKM